MYKPLQSIAYSLHITTANRYISNSHLLQHWCPLQHGTSKTSSSWQFPAVQTPPESEHRSSDMIHWYSYIIVDKYSRGTWSGNFNVEI